MTDTNRPSNEQTFYRVVPDANGFECSCGHNTHHTIVYTDGDGEEVAIGSSWEGPEGKDLAEDICDLMNMAFDAGREVVHSKDQMQRLTFLEARIATIRLIEGELTAKAQQDIARLAREALESDTETADLTSQGSQPGETEPQLNAPGSDAPTVGTSAKDAGPRSTHETRACVGCERGLPLDDRGHHYGRISNTGPLAPYYLDLTVCTAQNGTGTDAKLPRQLPPGVGEGNGQPCYYCQERCNDLAGNPSQWSIALCHPDDPGRVKWHHVGCVSDRLHGRVPLGLPANGGADA